MNENVIAYGENIGAYSNTILIIQQDKLPSINKSKAALNGQTSEQNAEETSSLSDKKLLRQSTTIADQPPLLG